MKLMKQNSLILYVKISFQTKIDFLVKQEEIDELNRILQKQQEQHIENLRLTVARLRQEQATVC